MNAAAPAKDKEAPAEASATTPRRTIAGVNIEKLKDEDLRELHAQLGVELEARRKRVTAEFIADVKTKAEKLGLDPVTIAALLTPRTGSHKRKGGGTDARGAVKPKYRNLANHGETWAGRGAKPQWVKDHEATGGTLEDLLIPKP